MNVKKVLLILLCSIALAFVVGCGAAEESMDDAKDAMADAVDDAKDAAEDAVDDAADTAGDAYDAAKEGAEELADDAAAQLEEWKAALAEKETELEKLKEEVENLSVQDLASDKGKDLKDRYEKLKEEVQELRDKIGV